MVFLVALATVALVALPYAMGDRPLGADRWPLYLALLGIGVVAYVLRLVDLLGRAPGPPARPVAGAVARRIRPRAVRGRHLRDRARAGTRLSGPFASHGVPPNRLVGEDRLVPCRNPSTRSHEVSSCVSRVRLSRSDWRRSSSSRPAVRRARVRPRRAARARPPERPRGRPRAPRSAEPSDSAEPSSGAILSVSPDQLLFPDRLLICSDLEYPPMHFFDEAGDPIGRQRRDRPGDRRPSGPPGRHRRLGLRRRSSTPSTRGKCDIVISSMTITAARKEQVDLITYFQAGQSFVVALGNPENVHTQEDLCGKSIAAQTGTVEVDYLEGTGEYEGEGLSAACEAAGLEAIDIQTYQKDTRRAARAAECPGLGLLRRLAGRRLQRRPAPRLVRAVRPRAGGRQAGHRGPEGEARAQAAGAACTRDDGPRRQLHRDPRGVRRRRRQRLQPVAARVAWRPSVASRPGDAVLSIRRREERSRRSRRRLLVAR